jgi:hypothetical protein
MNLIPIHPLLTDGGDLVSLTALRGTLHARPIPLDAGTTPLSVAVSTQQISIALAGNVGVGSIFAASAQANETGFWLDAMSFAESPVTVTPDNIVSQTRWGYGLRIMFRARQLDTTFNLSFAMLGAAVQLLLASVSYEVQTIGLGPSALGAILAGVSQFGTLDVDTFRQLNSTVIENLKKLIEDTQIALHSRPIAVQLSIPVALDPIPRARSEVFAMRRIREGTSIQNALARAAGKYDVDAIRAVYAKIAPGLQDTDAPPASAQAAAKQWLG